MEHVFEKSGTGKSILVFEIDTKVKGLELKRFKGIIVPVNVKTALKALKSLSNIELQVIDTLKPQNEGDKGLDVLWIK